MNANPSEAARLLPWAAATLIALSWLAPAALAEEAAPSKPEPPVEGPPTPAPAPAPAKPGEAPGKPEEPAPKPPDPTPPAPDAPKPEDPKPAEPTKPLDASPTASVPGPIDIPGMVWVPPGECELGSSPSDIVNLAKARKEVIPELAWETSRFSFRHTGYFLGRYEVSNAQYAVYLAQFKTKYTTGSSALASLRDIATHFVHHGDKTRGALDKVSWMKIYEMNKEALTAALPELKDATRLENEVLPPEVDLVVYGHYLPDNWVGDRPPEGQETHPVRFVSYLEAAGFAQWAGFTIPTEQEWECAARAGDRRDYPWGNEWIDTFDGDGNRIVEKRTVWGGLGLVDKTTQMPITAPVDGFPEGRNPLGIHHLLGNVAEWTSSWIARYPKAAIGSDNLLIKLGYEGRGFAKVLRGGSLADQEKMVMRLSARNLRGTGREGPSRPMNRFPFVGFRCGAYFEPGRYRLEPMIESMDAGGWLKDETLPIARARFAGAMTNAWIKPGETAKDHVYVTGKANAILFAPREALFLPDEKPSAKSAAEMMKEAVEENPVILGVLHSDVGLENLDVLAPTPPDKKKDKRDGAPHTKTGKIPAGSYVLGLHHGRVGLFKRSLEFAAFLKTAKFEQKNLGKEELPPASTIQVDAEADLVSKCSFWIALGGKGTKPTEGFRLTFQLESEPDALTKAGIWR